MGVYAEMILDGTLCQFCGTPLISENGTAQNCEQCDAELNLKYTYVTFGSDHKHKIGRRLIDHHCVAVIKCDNEAHGRELAFQYFGTRFCVETFQDNFVSNMRYYPNGFINVN